MVNWEGLSAVKLQQAAFSLHKHHKVQRDHFVQIRRPRSPFLGCCLQVPEKCADARELHLTFIACVYSVVL